MKSTIIFDLDGTLIDSRKDLAAAINVMLKSFGEQPLELETICGFVGNGVGKLVERSIAGTPISFDQALETMQASYTENVCVHTTLYPGVEAGLKRLEAAGIPLAVATNKVIDCTELILNKLQVSDYFTHIVGDGSGFALKPNPECLNYIIKDTDSDASRSWMVGDHHTDLISGRNAGLKTVFLTYGIGDAMGEEYDMEFDTFDHMVDFFLDSHQLELDPPRNTK